MRGLFSPLFLLTASVTFAQLPNQPETVFPSDSQEARRARGAELLEAVCLGSVKIGKEIGCATGCPDYTDFGRFGDRFPWSLEAVTFGHFLSPGSDDAALWMVGCEPRMANDGGTVLLTRRRGKWSMLWYKSAIQTAQCHKAPRRDHREILVCIGTDGAQGNNATELYVEDLLNPKATLMAGSANDGSFFRAFDDTLTCGWQQEADVPDTSPVIRSYIDKVSFSDSRGPDAGPPSISVMASYGKKQMTREEVEACMNKHWQVLPSVKSYQLDFLYDGNGYGPAPASVDIVKMFESR